MASADFCIVTARVAACRAVHLDGGCCQLLRHAAGSSPRRQVLGVPGEPSGSFRHPLAPLAAQISPGKNANCRCTSAAFTVGCVPVGFAVMCQLASHPSALTMRFLSVASHLLHSGFLQTTPRGLALAFGSWLSLLTMSPSRHSHRGLSPHKFAPMLGAHPALERSSRFAGRRSTSIVRHHRRETTLDQYLSQRGAYHEKLTSPRGHIFIIKYSACS